MKSKETDFIKSDEFVNSTLLYILLIFHNDCRSQSKKFYLSII